MKDKVIKIFEESIDVKKKFIEGYVDIIVEVANEAGLKGFTAAVLGGIGNIFGAMIGGILLGLTESLATTFFPASYKDGVAFVILILVLIFRPWGLMGEKITEKV